MFFTYTYHWTYCLTAEIIRTIVDCRQLTTRRQRWQRLLDLGLPLLIFGAPFLWLTVHSMTLPEYADLIPRLGLIENHWPAAPRVQLWLAGAGAALWCVRRSTNWRQETDWLLLLPVLRFFFFKPYLPSGPFP